MKKNILLFVLFTMSNAFAQEHFGGITTSSRVGILNAGLNPSELANLSSKFEFQFVSTSVNVSNNKISVKDITGGKDLKDLIFADKEVVNFNIDAEISGPGLAIKMLGFGFAITSKANVKANLSNVDPTLADALSNSGFNSILGLTNISSTENQRINATAWGEIGLSVAHKIYKNESHSVNGGVSFKLLFPGSYANIGARNFKGTVVNSAGNLELTDASTSLNMAYSGNLNNSFVDFSDYTKFSSIYGKLGGMVGDVGIDYQYKPEGGKYKLKIGASIKDIGSMTFKKEGNYSNDYNLSITGTQHLNLNQFQNVTTISQVEDILKIEDANGNINFTESNYSKDFVVKLPTTLNLYADIKLFPKMSITAFMRQKLNKDSENDQIISQNSISITPRFNLGFFEAFIPIAKNEISGTATGFGFRLGGFFIGSNSAVTALMNNSKQVDIYTGFRFGILGSKNK